MRDSDDLIVSLMVTATGAIPVAASVVHHARFGAAATIGLGAVVVGLVGLANEWFRGHLPRARMLDTREVGCPPCPPGATCGRSPESP